MKNHGRASENGEKVGGAAVCKKLKAALLTISDKMNFNHTGKMVHLGKFV